MNKTEKKDMLCLLSAEKLNAMRPYSNISEYCLRGGEAVKKWFLINGVDAKFEEISDYELFSIAFERIQNGDKSFVARRVKKAIDDFLEKDSNTLSKDEIWIRASELLDSKSSQDMFLFDLDFLGMPRVPWKKEGVTPKNLNKTKIDLIHCPFGTDHFDLLSAMSFDLPIFADNIDSVCASSAVFCNGFLFEEPNEYAAKKAEEKMYEGKKISDGERAMLGSQLLRILSLECAKKEMELMLFLPSAPNVRSMGEIEKFLEYIDMHIRGATLKVTAFAPDAVGLCFAAGIASKRYNKITAETGMCGNGCGCSGDEAAAYWGMDLTDIRRASLSSSPAFIGK